MRSWYSIYSERMNKKYRNHVANKYATFIEAIHRKGGHRFIELGCGAGNITRILREIKKSGHYTLVDSCPRMLELAIENNASGSCNFLCEDIRNGLIVTGDVSYSHGVLEHFDNWDIKGIVDDVASCVPVQIHYVPGAKYRIPSRGDERLLEPEQWEEILKEFKPKVCTFNDGYDIIIEIGDKK